MLLFASPTVMQECVQILFSTDQDNFVLHRDLANIHLKNDLATKHYTELENINPKLIPVKMYIQANDSSSDDSNSNASNHPDEWQQTKDTHLNTQKISPDTHDQESSTPTHNPITHSDILPARVRLT